MAIEAMKGAGMSYAGSSSASDVKAESQAKVETASNAAASDDLMKKTIQIDTKETDKNGKDGNRDDSQAKQTISENSQIKKAVDEINKRRTIPRQSSESMMQPTVSLSRSLTKTRRKS